MVRRQHVLDENNLLENYFLFEAEDILYPFYGTMVPLQPNLMQIFRASTVETFIYFHFDFLESKLFRVVVRN